MKRIYSFLLITMLLVPGIAYGQSLSVSVNITQPINCNGDSNGELTAITNGGTPPYTHDWDSGADTDSIYGNLSAGTYNLMVTDANGINVNITTTLAEPAAINGIAAAQLGANCQGTITVSANGGTGTLQYALNGGAATTNNVFSGLTPNTYNISITDANTCSFSISNIDLNNDLTISNINTTPSACTGSTGSMTIIASGGTAPFSYSADGTTFSNSPVIANLASGAYNLVVLEDVNGCRDTSSTNIANSNSTLNIDAVQITPTACGSPTGSITILGSGGVPPYSYSIDGSNFTANQVFNSLAAGTFTVYIRDNSQCEEFQNNVVVGTNGIQIDSVIINDISCNGFSDGLISLNYSGAQGAVQFDLTGTSSATQSSPIFNNLSAGTYAISITDQSNGCTDSRSNLVISSPSPLALSLAVQNSACDMDNGLITASASGGTPPYMFKKNNDNFTANNVFNNLPPGTYLIQVMDSLGCDLTESTTIITPSLLQYTFASVDSVACKGGNEGVISLVANSAPGPYKYYLSQFSTNQLLDSIINVNPNDTARFSNLPAGIYQISTQDNNACPIVRQDTIFEPSGDLNLSLVSSASQIFIPCYGQNSGTLNLQATGGNGSTFTYFLENDAGTLGSQFANTALFSNLAADSSYFAWVMDSKGCTDTLRQAISEANRPSLTDIMGDSLFSLCNFQDTLILQGLGIYNTLNFSSTSPFLSNNQFIPSRDSTLGDTVQLFINVTGNDNSSNQCPVSDTFRVDIHPRPLASLDLPTDSLFCDNDTSNYPLVGTESLRGIASMFNTTLFSGEGVRVVNGDTFFQPRLSNLGGYTLQYQVTDNIGCSAIAQHKVFVLPTPAPEFIRDSICEGQATTFEFTTQIANSVNSSLQSFFGNNSLNYEILNNAQFRFQGNTPTIVDNNNQVQYTFPLAGEASLQLIYTTSLVGCSDTLNQVVEVGDQPEPAFSWRNACFGDVSLFSNLTPTLEGVARDQYALFQWKWGDGLNSIDSSTVKEDTTHLFPSIGTYQTSLILESTMGCIDSISQEVFILPVVEQFPYDTSFEASDAAWVSEGNTRWKWGGLSNGMMGWYTELPSGVDSIQAILNSPCFDLNRAKISRPVIGLDIRSDAAIADGTVLQALYTDQDSSDWFVVGEGIDSNGLESGLDWYNSSFIFSRPGGQKGGLGWTGQDSLAIFRNARHKLDALQNAGRVRFRLAYGSEGGTDLLGAELDAFSIVERNRAVSIEAFTEEAVALGDSLRKWQGSNLQDAIVIRYPWDENSPYFVANPAPPRARSLFYGISVPEQLVMDGNAFNDSLLRFSQKRIDLRSLKAADFKIDIDTSGNADPFRLESLNAQTINQELIVSVLIVEKDADQIMVVRKMLPDPAGISFYDWAPNQVELLSVQWQADDIPSPKIVGEYDSLAVVIMIQDQASKEILQSAISPIWRGILDPSLIRREANPVAGAYEAKIYPNPSTGIFKLQFGVPDPGQKTIEVWDMQARTVYREVVWGEITEWKLNLRNLPSGVYQLVVKKGNGELILQDRLIKSQAN